MFKHYRSRTADIKILKASNAMLILYGIVMTAFAGIMCIINMRQVNDGYEVCQTYEAQISTQQKYLNTYIAEYRDFRTTVDELLKIEVELDEQNQSLVASNEEYFEELEEFRSREELYDKYSYAMYYAGQRNDITFDQLRTLEECIKTSSIPDADLVLSWAMCESHGFANATNPMSGAKGYGQFLDSSSRFVYCDLLGETDWTPAVALDGETNLRMMVALIDYLYRYYNHDAYGMLRNYTGFSSPAALAGYEAKLNGYLQYSGKTFAMINQMY